MIHSRRLVHKEGLLIASPLFYICIFIVSRTYFHIFIKIVRVLLTITHHLVKLRWLK